METKEELILSIQDWITIDNEMKMHQTSLKELRQKKKTISDKLKEVMKTNEIDCFDTSTGKLLISKTKTKNKKIQLHYDGRSGEN